MVCWGENQDGQLGIGHTQPVGLHAGDLGSMVQAANIGIEDMSTERTRDRDAIDRYSCNKSERHSKECFIQNKLVDLHLTNAWKVRHDLKL